ncbi:transposase [Pseudarthrobacter raffinosi]|uniref:transposase n=1 Tax=Pseudarthrobacter raffinosi TaxID=2953651 RepID=UPI00208FF6BF|nr:MULTISPECIES: transposase [unclassified Pseudarthrobacter]MCO4251200.1 transposase [Pseudarthrobacter sp. MDT3-9]MCO4265088.1 transposase [Pseudarthrobacter sp. MDT3-26]
MSNVDYLKFFEQISRLPETITVLYAFHVVKLAAGTPARSYPCLAVLPEAQQHLTVRPERGRELVNEVIASFPPCPIPEVARLARTVKQWKTAILAYFDTNGSFNGPTKTNNGIIETTRRIARGFRNFPSYRIRCLPAADGHRPYRMKQTIHA